MKNFSFHKGWSRLWYSFILGILFTCPSVRAMATSPNAKTLQQTHQVSGIITNTTGTLPGASVTIKGKNTGTMSDINGKYQIAAAASDTLVMSFIGYKPLYIPVNGRSIINVQLQDNDATQLQEVVVNAGYYSVKEKERTGSIAKISSKDIEKQPVSNPLAAMQGRMSGVNIVQNTGAPGGGFDIQVRGINSLRADGNTPLYIVDGVPYSSQSLGDIQTSASILAGTSSPLSSINPSDIESIEVLKDADATAIYGSRGANGVILITTKKGKEGKTKFSFHSYSGIGNVTRTMKMMNTQQYLAMRREAFANDGITAYPFYAYDINGIWDQNRYTDWRKELIGGTALFNNIQGTLSGGSKATQFLVSGTYRKETTVFPGDDHYTKGAVLNSITHHSSDDKFNFNLSVNYAKDKNTIQASDLTTQAYTLAPNAPALYDSSGNLNWENGTFNNPLANSLSQYENKTANLIASSVLSYKLFPNWEVKTSLGYNDTNLSENRTMPSTMYNPAYGVTSASSLLFVNNGKRSSWIIEPQVNWNKQWSAHKVNMLVGTTFQSQNSERLSQLGIGFASNSLIHSLGAASMIQTTGNQISEYKYQAFFGRLNYNYNDKYIINLTGRRDGSSRFGPGNRFANFGAIGAAWLFSKERVIADNLSWLSFGKLRGSYGTTGSDQIGDYQFLDSYSISGNTYGGVTGLQPTQLFNPKFGWETNKKLEFAAELGFFNDKIMWSTAWYQNRSSNQLVGIPLPATTGFPSMQANLDASVQNRGLETELRTTNFKNKNFTWTTSLNLTIPKNKLLEFKGLEGSTYANTYVVGQPLNIIKGYHYTGIDPATGTYQFQDYNNDGQITSPLDRQYISDISQKWFGGLSNQFRYKNWEMDFLFQFVKQNGKNYLYAMNLAGTMTNLPVYALNHWPDGGTNPDVQVYTTGANGAALDAYFRFQNSNATISDASFARLKSMSLSYKIPSEWSKTFSGKVYLQGQNLLTFTNYKGVDPENQSMSYLPPLRQYTLGLQLSF